MKASIDIGTNTILLLVAELKGDQITIVHEEQRVPRLGKGVDTSKILNEDSIQRVLSCLGEYKQLLAEKFPEVKEVTVTATSAVRDAQNRDNFMSRVKEKTGFEIRLLSGDEEAQYTFEGAISMLDIPQDTSTLVLDIGGGSTEVALGDKNGLIDFHSFDMGSVRFNERFLLQNPPYQEEIFQCRDEIKRLFSTKRFKVPKKVTAIGVAGTATSLAAIDLQLEEYEIDKLNGHKIDHTKLSKSINIFSLHTYDQLLELSPVFLKGREDIFLAGLLILDGFMNFYDLDEIQVSTGGIRHGALLVNKKIQN